MLANSSRAFASIISVLGISLLLSACEEASVEAPADPPIRAIKTLVLEDQSAEQIRRISGIVEAQTVTDLAFETGGQITKLDINVGDYVDKGEVLGELDSEPFKLRVDSARGEVDRASANLRDAKEKFEQQSALRKKGITTKTKLDTAIANLDVAESQLKVAQSSLSAAERELRKTQLRAPFRGRVSEKYVNVFSDVQARQQVVQVHTEGKLKVIASVPEGLVQKIKPGDYVSVGFPTLQGLQSEGTIEDIGSRAGAANAFPIEIVLNSQYPELRPGITAEVTFRFASETNGSAFIVPNTALLPSAEKRIASVFVYDEAGGVVNRKKVTIMNVRDNELEIEGPLKAGDIIATAGVSFLTDGMKVKLWKRK